MIEKFLEALDEENVDEESEYGFIANFIANYYNEMSKFDLRTILLEYIYAVHEEGSSVEESVIDSVRENLEDKECRL